MEFEDARITPTSKKEAQVFSKLLSEQDALSGRPAADTPMAEKGEQLSVLDSYRLFCAMERAIKDRNRQLSERQTDVIVPAISRLAQSCVDDLQTTVYIFPDALFDTDTMNTTCRLAGEALRASGE